MTEYSFDYSLGLLPTGYAKPAKEHPIVNIKAYEEVLNEIEKRTHFNQSLNDVQGDILSSVSEILSKIFSGMEKKCDFFKNMTLIEAGSYFSGTRIEQPDEFDYVVDINSLTSYFASHQSNFVVTTPEKGFAINLLNIGEDELKVFYPPQNEGDSEFVHRYFSHGINDLFDNPVNQYIPKSRRFSGSSIPPGNVYKSDWAFRIKYIFRQTFIDVIRELGMDLGKPLEVSKEVGSLKLMDGLVEHLTKSEEMISCSPTVTLELVWRFNSEEQEAEPFPISVDITPSFIVPCNVETLHDVGVNVENLKLASTFLNHDVTSLRVLPLGKVSDMLLWKISFSHTETDVIRNSGKIHQNCLRILKWMNCRAVTIVLQDNKHIRSASEVCERRFRKTFYELFISYSVKTAMLWHVLECKNDNFSLCFLDILDNLVQNVQKGSFFQVFVRVFIKSDKMKLESSIVKYKFVSKIQETMLEIAEMENIDTKSCIEILEKIKSGRYIQKEDVWSWENDG